MKFYFYLLPLLFTACANFQQVQLEQQGPVNPKLVLGTIPASNVLLFNGNGIIDNFDGRENLWEPQNIQLFLDLYNGSLMIKADTVESANYIFRKFNPLYFTKASHLILEVPDNEKPDLKVTLLDRFSKAEILERDSSNSSLAYKIPAADAADANIADVVEIRISGFKPFSKVYINSISVE